MKLKSIAIMGGIAWSFVLILSAQLTPTNTSRRQHVIPLHPDTRGGMVENGVWTNSLTFTNAYAESTIATYSPSTTNLAISPHFAGTVQIGTNKYPAREFWQSALRDKIASGEVCGIVGHIWRGGRPGESDFHVFADYHPNTSYRTCKICGTCQSQKEGDWK